MDKKSQAEQVTQNYEAFFNSIDDFLFVLDVEGKIIHVNDTVTDRLGYKEKELIGKSILIVHPKERRDEASRIVGEMLIGKTKVCPVPIITKSGKQIPVETRITNGLWDGKPALFGVTKDVSQLILSEEKFSKVFQINPSACGLSDIATQKYIEVNDAFYNLLGFNKDEVIGKTVTDLDIISQEVRDYILSKADKNGRIINVDADIKAKSGEMKHVLLSADTIYIQDQKLRFTVVNDISERKKNLDEIKYQAELLLGLSKVTDCILTDGELTNKNIFKALEALGSTTIVDRVYIFEHKPGLKGSRGTMSQRYEWSRKNVESQINNPELQNIEWDKVAPRWYDNFIKGDYISGEVAKFPKIEKEQLEQQNIISLLAIPIEVKGKLWGFIGFDSCEKQRTWTQSEVGLLRSVANSFAVTIERLRTEDQLRLKSALLESQINSTRDGILIVDNNNKRLLSNKRIVELFNIPSKIVDDKDDSNLLKYITSLSKEPDIFLKRVDYLYAHPDVRSLDEVEFKNGIFLERYTSPVVGVNGENYGRIWIFRDITSRKKIEIEALNHAEDLERLNKHMIDREIKMIELKDEIQKLKGGH